MTIAILHAVHDISNSLTPTYISNLFTAQSSISSHSTQLSTRGDYYVKHSIKIKQSTTLVFFKTWCQNLEKSTL